jgi:DMSO reductase family type II enzyme heme b subunit
MLPHPRDFTKGVYKIRTTASGELPTDADLRHIIEVGMPGTGMPEWKSRLSADEITAVISYIKSFSSFFKGQAPKAITLSSAPGSSDAGIAEGRKAFEKLECFKCHGQAARGDGKSAPTLKDDYGHPIRAADLSESWKFRGGSTVEQIYARLRTGLDGTPMPSFADAVDNKIISDEQLWRVAQYIHSLSPAEAPVTREVVRASLVNALPKTVDDAAWRTAERFWVPLVGQIIDKPRWFSPTVDGIWVQAVHDNRGLAIKLTWDDPSHSPDPTWNEWLGRVATSMTDVDGPLATQQGPDRLVVQWPQSAREDAERPYFLGGSTKRPVDVWRWSSDPASGGSRVEEGAQTGLGHFTASASTQVTQASKYTDGQWELVLSRPLTPSDTTHAARLAPGRAIPIAFYAADGSNGEDEIRGAVSTWYAVYLDVPTPTRVFVAPLATILLSAGLGMLLVTRAQRRERESDPSHTEER